jgi:hypothetical protein
MQCADCGCEVARGGIRIEVCGRADCCCATLPIADEPTGRAATQPSACLPALLPPERPVREEQTEHRTEHQVTENP